MEAALKGMLKPIYEEKVRGQAQIREIFRSSKFGVIAGCMVAALLRPERPVALEYTTSSTRLHRLLGVAAPSEPAE